MYSFNSFSFQLFLFIQLRQYQTLFVPLSLLLNFQSSSSAQYYSNSKLHYYFSPTDDKLEILQVLIDQILTYADVRDLIDEKMEKARRNRADFRLHYSAQMKKEREEVFK
jgi:hypothetical protein